MAIELPVIHCTPAPQPAPERDPERDRLVTRARLLARVGLVWHGIEAAVAIAAGAVAGSIALVAFGITLASGDHPGTSPVGIGLSIVTLIAMPVLANAKASVARQLDSSAGHSESRQNLLCAYLSAALLVGLTLNAAFGWWWADPATALIIAAVAAREGRESWRGESCCTTDGCC